MQNPTCIVPVLGGHNTTKVCFFSKFMCVPSLVVNKCKLQKAFATENLRKILFPHQYRVMFSSLAIQHSINIVGCVSFTTNLLSNKIIYLVAEIGPRF